jgi:hypothetical protein
MNLGSQIAITLVAAANDLDSPTYSFGTVINLTPASGGSVLSGINARRFSRGDLLWLINASPTDPITLKHASGLSLDGNRLSLPGANDLILFPLQGVMVYYDGAQFQMPLVGGSQGADMTYALGIAATSVPVGMAMGPLEILSLDIPNPAATTTFIFAIGPKLEIIDVHAIKDVAGAANTIQVTTAADVAITNAMAYAVDATITRAGTLAKATRTLAAAATFKVVVSHAAGSDAGQLFLHVVRRA